MEEQVLIVDTAVDENDGSATEGEGLSLREAVAIANSTTGDETIELQSGQTYELSSGLDIASRGGTLTIRGLGDGATIDANELDRVLHAMGDDETGATLILENITVTGGRTFTSVTGDSDGAGILIDNLATAELKDCTITGNATLDSDDRGGGIANEGTLSLNNCVVSDNSAGEGGGIYTNYGVTTIVDSTITNNSANEVIVSTGVGVGGGVSHRGSGPLEIDNTTISDNSANSAGGGVSMGDLSSDNGSLRIINSTISGNTAPSGAGVTSRRAESSNIDNTVIENNTADFGGGVFVASGVDVNAMTIDNSTIRNNIAYGDGGGIYADNDLVVTNTTISGNQANDSGGGVKANLSDVRIYDSVIDGNSAGGDAGGAENVNVITDSTVSNNTAGGNGGGISTGLGVILDSTISGNTADGSGGGISTSGGLFQYYVLAISNTTISGNSARENGGGIDIIGGLDSFASIEPSEGTRELFNAGVVATNVTITDNLADSDNNGEGDGGGIHNPSYFDAGTARVIPGKLDLSNSILEGNFDTSENNGEGLINPNLSGPAKGAANNLVGDLTGLTVAEFFVATEAESLGQGSDLTANPLLSELQDNGGPTQTHTPLSGSPAINAGSNDNILQETFVDINGDGEPTTLDFNDDGDSDDTLEFDQRGAEFSRIFNDTVDIGAVEVQDIPSEPGANSSSTVYRFFNPTAGVHFYTADTAERDYVRDNLNNYDYEGESYITADPLTGSPDAVYRFFNSTTGVHLYTTDENERDYIIDNLDNFVYEDVKFYAYETEASGTVPVYRFYEPTIGVHFYTPNEGEKTSVEDNLPNYNYEGIAYYVPSGEI